VKFSGNVRSRVEVWDWFDTDAANNDYAYSGNQIRFGWSQQRKRFDWQLEFMAPILLGLPNDAIAAPPQGQLGLGGAYYGANNARNAAMIFPKQAYVRLKFGGGHNLRLGRFEWMDGGELTPKDATLAALKRDRIAQRLIAPFGWTHVGRAFDGFHYALDRGRTNFTVTAALPTRGVFQVDGWNNVNVGFVYASANRAYARGKYVGDVRGFASYYHDWRPVLKTDNRPLAVRQRDLANIRIYSFGGHSIGKWELPSANLDVLFWGVLQTGDWGRLSHRASAGAAEAGIQPAFGKELGFWLRGGYNASSGDSDPLDSRHGTFFQMLPTPRPYARFPFFNMMNNQDSFGEVMFKPAKTVQVRFDYHWLRLANSRDLWFLGGGAFQPWTFGFVGRPSGGARGLANLYDVSADWNLTPKWNLNGYFGYVQGRGAVRSVYPLASSGAMGFLEVFYRF
jgi:hypothetical protein